MKTLRTFAKIISVALVLSLVFAFAACDFFDFFGGSLKLESFIVDRSSVKTVYYIGEEIDFTGIRATVKYSDSDLNAEYTFDDLTITYDEDITATVGQKDVKVSFQDPHLDVEQSTTVQITVKEDPSAPKHDSYVNDATGMKTTYFVGETIDFTGIKIVEKFTNGGADVEMTDLSLVTYEYDTDITATAGTKSVVVKYNGESAGVITITVNKPAITSLELDTTGVTLEYLVGDTVSFSGLKANVTYENGDDAVITDFTFVTDLATLTEEYGTKAVTVKIDDAVSGTTVNRSFEIKVDGIVDYTLDSSDMNLSYLEGESVSFAGIKVDAVYYYGKTEAVAFEDLTFVHDADLTATVGNKQVTVKVGDEEVGSFIIAVGDIPTAKANEENVKLSYRVGETVSLEGLTVTLTFTDGNPEQNIGLADLIVETALNGLTDSSGTKTVTVKYRFDEYYVYANLTITVYGIDHYRVDSSEMGKKEYIVGDTIDYTGVKVYAVYNDGGADVLIDSSRISYSVNGMLETVGTVESGVLVDGKSAQINISVDVKANTIDTVAVGGNYTTVYKVGDTVDLSGLTVTLTYLNGDVVVLTYADLEIADVDTSSVATGKEVVINFKDAKNGNVAGTVSITVDIIRDKDTIAGFEKDANITAFESDNTSAGTLEYGTAGFSGQFVNGVSLYVIGDDNLFKFAPSCSILDKTYTVTTLENFYSVVDIYVHDGSSYVTLDKTSADSVNYTYTLNGETIVTVNTYEGSYQFTKPLDRVKISVMPSTEYYEFDNVNPVVLEARVIDAYNVYTADELSVIDNYSGTRWGRDTEDNPEWASVNWTTFKDERGLAGIDPAGVVLHNDIKLTYKNVPSSFFYKYEGEIIYKNANGDVDSEGNTITKNFDGYYLKDETVLYYRSGSSDFVIEGNFFQIDADGFPIIASPSIFGTDSGKDYGSDYSNSALFLFQTIDTNWVSSTDESIDTAEEISHVTIQNLAIRGNAGRDGWVITQAGNNIGAEGELVTAGGLIMLKSARHANVTLDNVVNNCFFISYFPDTQGNLTVKNSKCYDSYQNAAFVWADSTLTIDDSYINGTGGPIVIAQSVDPKDNNVYYDPVVNITDTKMETHTSGEEIWFQAVGATEAVVPGIKALGSGLNTLVTTATQNAYSASWVDSDGNMNIKAALMSNADNASEALSDILVQGTVATDGSGINRWRDTSSDWSEIMAAIGKNTALASYPFITVYGSDGTAYTMYFVQQGAGGTFYDLEGEIIGGGSSITTEIITALATADEVVLHQGGLSVLFELYH